MKRGLKILILLITLNVLSSSVFSQEEKVEEFPSYFRLFLNVDSIIYNTPEHVVFFPEIIVFPQKEASNFIERRRNDRLVRNFKKVYPYVLDINEIYANIEDTLGLITDDRLRRKYMDMREDQIMDYFRPKLSSMTLSQGILMVQLLDRETGNTAYELVEELRGSLSAFFWQGFARLFGNNLKVEYDPYDKHKDIERLVIRYHNGTL